MTEAGPTREEIRQLRRAGMDEQRAQLGPEGFVRAIALLQLALVDEVIYNEHHRVIHVPVPFEQRLADAGLLPEGFRERQIRVTALFHGYREEPERYLISARRPVQR